MARRRARPQRHRIAPRAPLGERRTGPRVAASRRGARGRRSCMTNSDSPAGTTGGPVTLSGLDDLPEKLRVHALAKLLGRTSREVVAALLDLGFAARSVQSSVDRKTAEQVAVVLVPELAATPAPPPEDVLDTGVPPGVVDEPPGTVDEPAVL